MDKGPAVTGRAFAAKAAALRLAHHRIRPRPLKQNAVVERSHSTLPGVQCLPHFHHGRVADIPGLDRSLRAQTRDCSEGHPNHGNYTRRRIPPQAKRELERRLRQPGQQPDKPFRRPPRPPRTVIRKP